MWQERGPQSLQHLGPDTCLGPDIRGRGDSVAS